MFELSGFELSGTKYKTFLLQTQGTWKFVRNNESSNYAAFQSTDVHCINACMPLLGYPYH